MGLLSGATRRQSSATSGVHTDGFSPFEQRFGTAGFTGNVLARPPRMSSDHFVTAGSMTLPPVFANALLALLILVGGAPLSAQTLTITNATVVDVSSGALRRNSTVVVDGNRIVSV